MKHIYWLTIGSRSVVETPGFQFGGRSLISKSDRPLFPFIAKQETGFLMFIAQIFGEFREETRFLMPKMRSLNKETGFLMFPAQICGGFRKETRFLMLQEKCDSRLWIRCAESLISIFHNQQIHPVSGFC